MTWRVLRQAPRDRIYPFLVLILVGFLIFASMPVSIGPVVVIDAGHGRSPAYRGFTGAINRVTGDAEDTFNLDIALKLRRSLKSRGVEVYLTRSDEYLPPDYNWDGEQNNSDRAYLANNLQAVLPYASKPKADVYISLHLNATLDRHDRGTTAVYSTAGEAAAYAGASRTLAEAIHRELTHVIRPVSPPFSLNGLYMENLEMPHAVIEVAFITNWADLQWIRKDYNRQVVAELVAEGLLNWWTVQGQEHR